MPYIKDKEKRHILNEIVRIFRTYMEDDLTGNLNYLLYKLAKETCHNYKDYRDFIGELEAAKLEIYRRLVSKHEDEAIKRNGDVE